MKRHAYWNRNDFWLALARGAGGFCILIGALVLFGWWQDIPVLKSISPGWVAMKANTALGFALSGMALWLGAVDPARCGRFRRDARRGLAGGVLLIGALSLFEYLSGADPGIDQLLFYEPPGAIGTLAPGRMAPTSALDFILIGMALLIDGKTPASRRLVSMLATLAAIPAMAALLIFLYGTANSYGLSYFLQMAAHTAFAFLLLSAGLLCRQPESGLVALIRSHDSGGALARRLLPISLLLPVLIGWLKLYGDRHGLYEPDFGVAVVALSYVVMLVALVIWGARFLARVEAESEWMHASIEVSEARMRTLVASIPDLVWLKDPDGVYLACNSMFERFFGAREHDILGKTDYDFVSRELADFFRANDQAAIEAGGPRSNEEWLTFADTGQRILAETTKTPMFGPGGELLGVLGIARDITQRHEAEASIREAQAETERLLAEANQSRQALRDRNTFVESLLENAPIGFAVNTMDDGRFVFVNRRFVDIYGVPSGSLEDVGDFFAKVYPDSVQRERIRARVMADIASGDPARMHWDDVEFTAADGGLRVISAANIPLPEQNLMISTVWDVTDRHRAEAAHNEFNALLSTFISHSPIYAFVKEVRPGESRTLMASENYRDMIGIPGSEMAGKIMSELFPAEFAEKITADDWAVVSGGEVLQLDEELNGRSYITVKFPIPLAGKNYLAGYTIDITERKLAEQKLAQSERHFRSLFENMMDGYAYCRMAFEEGRAIDFTYLEVNEAFGTLTGLKDVVGRSVSEVIPGIRESNPELFEIYGRVALGGAPEAFETYVGELRSWFSIAVYSPKEHHFVAVFENISERKQAEKRMRELNSELERRVLERTAKLEEANKELEAFSYSVSHDLRAPLRAIAGFVDLLRKRNYEAIDDKGRHYMDVISDAAEQMGRLIDDILTFSRIGRAEMSLSRVDMNALFGEVRNILQPEAEGRRVEWKVGPLPEVVGERTMLALVLQNLLSNALKFTRTRDTAVIEIGTAEGSLNETVYYIRDNGVGFDMRHVDKLFGLFQRLHPQEQFPGTGVGLANVQRIVQRLGGRVWAEGRVNEGAMFYFALPKTGDEDEVAGTDAVGRE